MRRKIAESYQPSYICPLCEFLTKDNKELIEHLIYQHRDEEAFWNSSYAKLY